MEGRGRKMKNARGQFPHGIEFGAEETAGERRLRDEIVQVLPVHGSVLRAERPESLPRGTLMRSPCERKCTNDVRPQTAESDVEEQGGGGRNGALVLESSPPRGNSPESFIERK